MPSLSREAARALEAGRWNGVVSRALASAFAPFASRGVVRPATVPPDIGLVCVGGATLGGSGKTRVAIACARELARLGARVTLVGHAYRASARSSRVVSVDDRLEDVGDEALVCAKALVASRVPVVIGPTRQAAIDHAVALTPRPSVIVLDGPLRVRPPRGSASRSLSLLAVDANRPWGSGRLPPAGDLRAPLERLLAEADHVVPVDAAPDRVRWTDGRVTAVETLRHLRLGLFTAIARPDRLVRALAAVEVWPCEVVSAPDHGPLSAAMARRLSSAPVDAWIGTPKCVLHLERLVFGAPLGVLDGKSMVLPAAVAKALATACQPFEYVTHLHGAP